MDIERCSEICIHLSIVVEENGRKFNIKNSKRESVKKIQVDGCLITDARQRCDYAFEIGQPCRCVVYLELKGADIEHAFNQLTATIKYFTNRHKSFKRVCHIVASRVPRAGPKVQNLKVQMIRKYQTLLFVGTQEVSINIEGDTYR